MLVEKCISNTGLEECYIFTDCRSAIDIVCRQKEAHNRLFEFRRIWKCMKELLKRQKKVRVIWIPGHAEIEFNEVADRMAKSASRIRTEEDEVEKISENVVFKLINENLIRKWSSSWDRSESGQWTKNLIKKVGKKTRFPRLRTTGMTYARALLNNAAVKDNMYRMGLADDRDCKCGEGLETVEHVILECMEEEVSRVKLREELSEIWMSSKGSGGLSFDLNSILAPFFCDILNVELADRVLMKVYDFLGSLTRNF